jgi:hypothetical protein
MGSVGIHRAVSYKWQAKDWEDTELGKVRAIDLRILPDSAR